MKVAIIIELDADEYADPDHAMGITNEAYDQLTGVETGRPELGWLGEIVDVEKVAE